MTKKRAKKKRGWSITAVVAVCMCLIAVFGWIVLAAEYAKEVEGVKFRGYVTPGPTGRGQAGTALAEAVCGLIDASLNGVREIANAPSVILFSLTRRTWATVGFVVIECLAAVFGALLKRLEKTLAEPPKVKRSGTPQLPM
jgi:hypothetical protein